MTDKDKIELLLRENKKLAEDNDRLKKLSTMFKQKEMQQATDDLIKTYEILKKKYKKLDRLRFIGMKTKFQYKIMVCILKIRKLIKI